MKSTIYLTVLISVLIFAEGAAADPNFIYLGNVQDANGLYVHSYKISNPNDRQAVPIYDLEVEYEYQYGWIAVTTPDGWTYEALGPMAGSRFVTGEAPCDVDEELSGFKIYAATPEVVWGGVTFTNESHVEVAEGTTVWPTGKHIPSVTQWGLIIMTLGLLTAGAVVIMRKRRVSA